MDGHEDGSSRGWVWSGTYVDAKFDGHMDWNVFWESPDMVKEGVTPSGNDVSDVGETRALREHDIGDEISPAYPSSWRWHLMSRAPMSKLLFRKTGTFLGLFCVFAEHFQSILNTPKSVK